MKKVIITLFCLSLTTLAVRAQDKKAPVPVPPIPQQGAMQQQAAPAPPAPVDPNSGIFKFQDKDNTHDYGEVPEGPTAEYDFEFKNTGKKPIVISEAHGSCGCTVPKWPHEPIPPKGKGVIHVTYNTNGRSGPISKEVTITSDAMDKSTVLHIRGMVKAKPAEVKPAENAQPAPPPPPAPKH
jgi:hypothetical protein